MNNKNYKQEKLEHANREDARVANVSLPIVESTAVSRRRFLEATGFSLSVLAINGCSRPDAKLALPMTELPEGMIPGRKQVYASTCSGCSAGCGLLVSVRDGRPLKMEGMPEHPLSKGGLCAIGQALPLGLYDSQRLQQPLHEGKETDWKQIDQSVLNSIKNIQSSGGAVRFVTSTITSPTMKESINTFLKQFKDGRHITFDAMSSSAILDAHEKTHGVRTLPHYLFDQAKVIVSFGADFLGTWISPVEFTAAWSSRRVPTEKHPEMSYHAHLEGGMSLTGGNADRRYRLTPDQYGVVLSQLHQLLLGNETESLLPHVELADLAKRLKGAHGESLVLCDSQDVQIQVVVNAINHLLGNYGKTIDVARPSLQRQGNDADVLKLVEEIKAGKVAALFVAGTDLVHNLPELAELISKVKLSVSFADRKDSFSTRANFVCPVHHSLESWIDAEPVNGIVSLSQPMLRPLGKTRSLLESLAKWSGSEASEYDLLRASWKKKYLAAC